MRAPAGFEATARASWGNIEEARADRRQIAKGSPARWSPGISLVLAAWISTSLSAAGTEGCGEVRVSHAGRG